MQRSSPEDVQRVESLVRGVTERIISLRKQGKRVHVIWDFDHVLAEGRSEDVLTLCKDLPTYFEYEERLCLEAPRPGPWLSLALRCAELGVTQDIVTARSSLLSFRVILFCLEHNLPIRWQLFVGHQPKEASYRIIFESLQQEEGDYYAFMVDDSERNVELFRGVRQDFSPREKALSGSIVAPRIRTYNERELRLHLTRVLRATGGPTLVRHELRGHSDFVVVPGGRKHMRGVFFRMAFRTGMEARVAAVQPVIGDEFRKRFPGLEPTTEQLYAFLEEARDPSPGTDTIEDWVNQV